MKIAKYVGDLLYDYECVVIPGLGGFITEEVPVKINSVTHNFSPPTKKVHFNTHLRVNDGLLVNYVAQHEQIGYKTAKQKVDQFALQCHNALNSGKKIVFKKIGAIYSDANQNIVFEQDTNENYNANSFGLPNLVSAPINRPTDEQKIKDVVSTVIKSSSKKEKKHVDRKGELDKTTKVQSKKIMLATRRKSSLSNQLTFLLIVALLMGSGYVYMRRYAMEYYVDRYIAHVPFFYSSVNDYLEKNINSTHVASLSRSTASFFPEFNSEKPIDENNQGSYKVIIDPPVEDDTPVEIIVEEPKSETLQSVDLDADAKIIAPEETIEVEPVIVSNNENIINDRYFIIAGSFSKETNALSKVNSLKKLGYNALIADTNKYGMYRVAFMSFNKRNIAEQQLVAIRNDVNQSAWLLVK